MLAPTVHFAYDQATIEPHDGDTLAAQAAYLARHPQARVRLEGNTDERGGQHFNLALGERRADAVRAYLIAHGVAPQQIVIISYGEARPVDRGHSALARARNRRVDFDYLKTAG